MSTHTFQDAYTLVRGRHTDQAWFALSQREITDLIYREIRALDRARWMIMLGEQAQMALAAE